MAKQGKPKTRTNAVKSKSTKRKAKPKLKAPSGKLTANQKKKVVEVANQLVTMQSALVGRAELQARLGKSYGDDRDIYKSLGYKKNLTFADYDALYARLDMAKCVIDKPIEATWQTAPDIVETLDEDLTDFEKKWIELEDKLKLTHNFARLDRECGLGQYAVLLIGADDGNNLNEPLDSAKEILFLRPFNEGSCTIKATVKDTKDARYGLPEMYGLLLDTEQEAKEQESVSVHWTRILHVADGLRQSNIYGTPRLQSCFNTLKNIELVGCGSAEMFWRGAFPGLLFNLAKDADIATESLEDFEEEIQNYVHKVQRYMRLQGIEVTNLAPHVVDPSPHLDKYIDFLSASQGIPKRILMGSERGELASSQDETNWNNHIEERRTNWAEAVIIRPFIELLARIKYLVIPEKGYDVNWYPIHEPTEKDRLATYVKNGVDEVFPPDVFLRMVMGLDTEEIKEINEILDELIADEEKDRKEVEGKQELTPMGGGSQNEPVEGQPLETQV
jgi:hypothetical protein